METREEDRTQLGLGNGERKTVYWFGFHVAVIKRCKKLKPNPKKESAALMRERERLDVG